MKYILVGVFITGFFSFGFARGGLVLFLRGGASTNRKNSNLLHSNIFPLRIAGVLYKSRN